MSWEEIKERIEMEDSPEARAIKEIREHEGKLVLSLEGKDIEVDFTISPVENAQMYYERAKKYKKKIETVQQKIKETKEKLKECEVRKTEATKEVKILPKKKPKKRWYEKFRWSLTSEGFLVVAGKDATQNEVLYKKYLEPDDIVLHADIHGAPLTIVKSQGKDITPLAVREAAEIAAAYSSAWKMKLGSVDVYWVRPEQVSKSPPAGQYLPKGSFMIYGEKNYLRKTEVKLAVGVMISESEEGREAKVFAGSVLGARAHCKYFVTVFPGDTPQHELAKQVKLKLLQKAMPEDKELIEKIPLEDFQRVLPGGGGDVLG
jgi:predicted ribosome quality control (RQC) complex YloA/Tae2 family protein